MHTKAPQPAKDLLEKRIQRCEQRMNRMCQVDRNHIDEVPRAALHIMVGAYEHLKTEVKGLKRLYADAKRGNSGKPV